MSRKLEASGAGVLELFAGWQHESSQFVVFLGKCQLEFLTHCDQLGRSACGFFDIGEHESQDTLLYLLLAGVGGFAGLLLPTHTYRIACGFHCCLPHAGLS